MSKDFSRMISSLKPSPGYFRVPEVVGIVILFCGLVSTLYLSFYVLNNRAVALNKSTKDERTLRDRKDQLELANRRIMTKVKIQGGVLDNLNQFSERFLEPELKGRLHLIEEINKLIAKDEVQLQGGISFEPVKAVDFDPKKRGRREEGEDKKEVFPSYRCSFGVIGDYNNFRKFLYDLENNKLFIILERLDLRTNAGDVNGNGNGNGNAISGTSRASRQVQVLKEGEVSVQISLQTFFQRPNNVVKP